MYLLPQLIPLPQPPSTAMLTRAARAFDDDDDDDDALHPFFQLQKGSSSRDHYGISCRVLSERKRRITPTQSVGHFLSKTLFVRFAR
jgi:hypothetical protein